MYIFGIVGSWGSDKKKLCSDISALITLFFTLERCCFQQAQILSRAVLPLDYQPAPISLLSSKQNFFFKSSDWLFNITYNKSNH